MTYVGDTIANALSRNLGNIKGARTDSGVQRLAIAVAPYQAVFTILASELQYRSRNMECYRRLVGVFVKKRTQYVCAKRQVSRAHEYHL